MHLHENVHALKSSIIYLRLTSLFKLFTPVMNQSSDLEYLVIVGVWRGGGGGGGVGTWGYSPIQPIYSGMCGTKGMGF